MKLKRLILQGFKSFKDRTVIHFDEGITGIVGPNGCGKSNVVDALFWVMGEQSAKHLRGSTMKDVIFAGSSKYTPASFAEVSLVLENDEGKHIHIGHQVATPSEIQLTRKLYRNGETEYRINDVPCRLRDIQEVFMDTGAGAKSYSIIAQGEINRLVQAKPEERRVMIEEVAGITKFKVRKKESLKKIEQTEQNLARLNDLQQEIEKNLKSLEKQAEKAERARDLKQRVEKYDLIVHSHKEFDLLKNYKEGKTVVDLRTEENENFSTRKNIIEIGLEEERFRKDEETAKIEELQKEFNTISKELAAAEERLVYLCKTQSEKEKLIETREGEIASVNQELAGRLEKLETLKAELDAWEKKGEEDNDFDLLEERVEHLKEELEFKTQSWNDLKDEIEAEKDAFNKIDQELFRNTSRLEEYAASLQDLTKEIEALEAQYSGVNTQIVAEREAVALAEKNSVELKDKEIALRAEIDGANGLVKELEQNFQAQSKTLIQTESKLQSLIEVNKSLEGKKEGISAFLKEHADGFALLGTLIKCEARYTKAVQTLLSEFMETLVATAPSDSDLFSWIEANEKNLDYLKMTSSEKLSVETIARLKLTLGDDLVSLSDILEMGAELKEKMSAFLDGYFIANTLSTDSMSSLSADIRFKAIASVDGARKVANLNGAKLVSIQVTSDEAQGFVARNNKIEELKVVVATLQAEVTALEAKALSERAKLEEQKTTFDSLRDQAAEARAQFGAKKSALDAKLSSFESGFTRLEILKNRKQEISKSRLDMIESEEKLSRKKEELSSTLAEKASRFDELAEEVEIQKSSYEDERSELLEKQVEARSFESTLKSLNSQIEDLNGQIERLNQRLESNKTLVANYNSEIDQIISELEDLEASNKETSLVLSDKEDVLNLLKDSLGQLLLSMKDREDEVKTITSSMNKNQREISELEVKLSQYIIEEEQNVRNIFEKYQIDLRAVLGKFLEYQESDYLELKDVNSMFWMETEEGTKEIERKDFEFVRRYGQDLKECSDKLKNYRLEFGRLGDINWQAIEDYERQKLRADFLKVQEVELKSSLEDLQKAIAHIDEKSKARFQAAYDEVNVRFQKVFPIIFGGGSADLKIVGDINDAECGIDIVAQPPGKKMQNINLMSGGEKAMTAVSLIFSIFLVKPSPFCLLDEVDAPLDDANVGRFNELLREMSSDSQFILITHNKKTMELNDTLYGVTMQEPGVSKAVSVQLH
ncbi:MAG: chromosome segregation protein SMC [Bacteriovorax sp.]